jgi:hypothetical protein
MLLANKYDLLMLGLDPTLQLDEQRVKACIVEQYRNTNWNEVLNKQSILKAAIAHPTMKIVRKHISQRSDKAKASVRNLICELDKKR